MRRSPSWAASATSTSTCASSPLTSTVPPSKWTTRPWPPTTMCSSIATSPSSAWRAVLGGGRVAGGAGRSVGGGRCWAEGGWRAVLGGGRVAGNAGWRVVGGVGCQVEGGGWWVEGGGRSWLVDGGWGVEGGGSGAQLAGGWCWVSSAQPANLHQCVLPNGERLPCRSGHSLGARWVVHRPCALACWLAHHPPSVQGCASQPLPPHLQPLHPTPPLTPGLPGWLAQVV